MSASSQYWAQNAQYWAQNAQYSAQNTQYWAPNTQYSAPRHIWCPNKDPKNPARRINEKATYHSGMDKCVVQ